MILASHLNLAQIEARMQQTVIDLHDAARRGEPSDVGVAVALRNIAQDLNVLVGELRRLLVTDIDSNWTELETRPAPLGD